MPSLLWWALAAAAASCSCPAAAAGRLELAGVAAAPTPSNKVLLPLSSGAACLDGSAYAFYFTVRRRRPQCTPC